MRCPPFFSSTLNIVLGRASRTTPSTSMASSLATVPPEKKYDVSIERSVLSAIIVRAVGVRVNLASRLMREAVDMTATSMNSDTPIDSGESIVHTVQGLAGR